MWSFKKIIHNHSTGILIVVDVDNIVGTRQTPCFGKKNKFTVSKQQSMKLYPTDKWLKVTSQTESWVGLG